MRSPLREAGRLINRTVTIRTLTRSRHSRTGFTAFLLHLSTTTELLVIDLVPALASYIGIIPREHSSGLELRKRAASRLFERFCDVVVPRLTRAARSCRNLIIQT
jgi:hypothetical protein